jgi:PPM family protein phosphatase
VLECLTRDHSFSQELLDAGMVTEEEARLLPAKNLVTRALGAGGDVDPEVNEFPLRVGDVLMMCSDGLTEMVDDAQIASAIFASVPDVNRAAQRLVDLANASGGRDNVSVVVIRLAGRRGLEPRRLQQRAAAAARPAEPFG